jgi:hypothetical protein
VVNHMFESLYGQFKFKETNKWRLASIVMITDIVIIFFMEKIWDCKRAMDIVCGMF